MRLLRYEVCMVISLASITLLFLTPEFFQVWPLLESIWNRVFACCWLASHQACHMGYDCTADFRYVSFFADAHQAPRYQPAKTGLETMPKFSTSLGCANAPYILNGEMTTYNVPFNKLTNDHSILVRGPLAVGTILIVEGASDATDIKYELTLRTDDESLLNSVRVSIPTADEVNDRTESRLELVTPNSMPSSSCMRYDMVMYVPPSIKKLHVETRSVAQIKFDTDSIFEFDALYVTMWNLDTNNMLLPHQAIHADNLKFDVTRGWLVGDVTIVNRTEIMTQRGDALMNVHVHPAPSSEDPPAPAVLTTGSGAGRTDIFYINHPGNPHRPISSTHYSSKNADIYLTYKEADFNGLLDINAKSWSGNNVQNPFKQDGSSPWVGDKDGNDRLVAKSPNGWVGLYF